MCISFEPAGPFTPTTFLLADVAGIAVRVTTCACKGTWLLFEDEFHDAKHCCIQGAVIIAAMDIVASVLHVVSIARPPLLERLVVDCPRLGRRCSHG
jgi:hypothetical protein